MNTKASRRRCRSSLEQHQDLRLHADVERRDRLVGEDQVGPERERAGDADALALAARELVRIAARRGRAAARPRRAGARPRARPPLPLAMPCTRIGSPSASAMRWRGSSAEAGSWNTICRRRRKPRSSDGPAATTSMPSKRTCPHPARSGAGRRARRSTCRSPIRRRCRAPRRARRRTRRRRARAPRRVFGTGQPRFALKVLARSRPRAAVAAAWRALMAPAPSSARRAPARRAAGSSGGSSAHCSIRKRAARLVAAAGRHVGQGRHLPGDRRQRRRRAGRRAASRRAAPRCRDGVGRRKNSLTGALSTTSPPYITITRSATAATTPRLCVIRRTASPSRACRSASSASTCAWIVTSSAVVGSSAISTFGEQASAIAIMTRWRMPPENWCG